MSDVSFTDPYQYEKNQNVKPAGIAQWLVARGLVHSEQQGLIVALLIAVIMFTFSAIILYTSTPQVRANPAPPEPVIDSPVPASPLQS